MTNTDLPSWLRRAYDRFVEGEGSEGSDLEKTRDAVAHAYADAVEQGDIDRPLVDLVTEGRDLFDKEIRNLRSSRKATMRQSLDGLLSVIDGTALLSEEDPILDWSFPLGTEDGRDKTLRYWTVDDWRTSWTKRFSGAAQQATAAEEFYQRAKRLVDAMEGAAAKTTGALFA